MLVQPGSRQLPRRVEELDGVSLGPLGEHGLLCDEAMSAIGGALMEQVLRTLVPAAGLVVVVGDLSVALRPEGGEERKIRLYLHSYLSSSQLMIYFVSSLISISLILQPFTKIILIAY